MTNEEQVLRFACLTGAGELDPGGDVEAQLMDRRQVREKTVSGETHCKAPLQAARVRRRSFEEGRRAGLDEGTAKLGWDKMGTIPGLHRFMDHVRQAGDQLQQCQRLRAGDVGGYHGAHGA